MQTPCIEVKNLYKHYGDIKAVDGIDLSVQSGTVFGVLGPNGAGKTTTLETLLGLKQRDGGMVRILGFDPEKDQAALRHKVSAQLQAPAVFGRLTVKELLRLFASFYHDPLPSEEVLQMVGLQEKQKAPCDSLSGGQKHRLAVALAVAANGDVVFLDEPTTGLDPQSRRQLWDVIATLRHRGRTVVLTTHYMDEAEQLCDQLVIIDAGRIIARGRPRNLLDEHFPHDVLEFDNPGFGDATLARVGELPAVADWSRETGGRVVLHSRQASATIEALQRFASEEGRRISDITMRRASLEDLFLKLTGRMIRQ